MTDELILTNAEIVTPEETLRGTLVARDGRIAEISTGSTQAPGAIDCDGDFVIPGLVELHTDNLERHLQPRPGVVWPRRAAVAAHDGEFVSVGVITIFDALRIGVMRFEDVGDYASEALAAINQLREHALLKADHYVHLRCEVCAPNMLEHFDAVIDDPRIRLVSVMDHTIGQRQFRREDKYRQYYLDKKGMSESEIEAFIADSRRFQDLYAEPHRAGLKQRAERLRAERAGFAVASHDDAEHEHVHENLDLGAAIAEFPTTIEAARLSREHGLSVLMGAPNLLRGFSHSGNISAMDLAQEGLLDILSSDYAPASLMLAAFKLAEETDYGLPAAIRTVTETPARVVGLDDRGALAEGKRADIVRVYRAERLCVSRGAWREGRRVM